MPANKSRKPRPPAAAKKDSKFLQIDVDALPLPQLIGFADHCAVEDRGDFWHLAFFEQARDGRRNTIARLVLPVDALARTIYKSAAQMHAELQRDSNRYGAPIYRVESELPSDSELAPVLSNFVGIARVGPTTGLDFYYMTPRSAHLYATQSRDVAILPVLSLQVPAGLLIAILDEVHRALPDLESRLPRASENKP